MHMQDKKMKECLLLLNKQASKLLNMKVCFFEQELVEETLGNELQKAYRLKGQVRELLDYKLGTKTCSKINQNDNVEREDVLKLMSMICGGYVEDDFSSYLSYGDFLQKKEQFDILRSLYANTQKKYRNRKVEPPQLGFRSLLLMIYLEENIAKLSRVRLQELFLLHRMVW